MNWHLFGMNPDYKDFMEKHPDKTMIGLLWSMHWRFGVFVFFAYIVLFLFLLLVAAALRFILF